MDLWVTESGTGPHLCLLWKPESAPGRVTEVTEHWNTSKLKSTWVNRVSYIPPQTQRTSSALKSLLLNWKVVLIFAPRMSVKYLPWKRSPKWTNWSRPTTDKTTGLETKLLITHRVVKRWLWRKSHRPRSVRRAAGSCFEKVSFQVDAFIPAKVSFSRSRRCYRLNQYGS